MARSTKLHIMFGDDGTLCDYDGNNVDALNASDSVGDCTCLNCLSIMRRNLERSVRWYTSIVGKGVVPSVFADKGIPLGECIKRLHDRKESLAKLEAQIKEVRRD